MHCVEHWAKQNSKTSPQSLFKTRWDTLGNDWRHFLNFEIFSIFLKIFEGSTLHGTVGKNFSFQKSPKTRLDTWERFGKFKNFEIFSIFFLNLFYVPSSNFKSGKQNSNFLSPENWPHIFKSRKSEKPCMEHWAKQFGKIASKHVQNKFGHIWKRIWALLDFWKFFDFFL